MSPRILLPFLFSSWIACTSAEESPTPSADAGAQPLPADGGPPNDADAPLDPACEQLRTDLAAALESERGAQRAKHAALGVYHPACGTIAVASSASNASPASTPETLFRIASISKTFLAATIVQLAEAKKLDLEAKIATWLPELPRASEVTVKMLLNHTSGIPDYLQTESYRKATNDRSRTPSVDERIAWVKDVPFTHEPGAQFEYSNTNYLVASRIVEKATGSTWAAQMREATFARAGLTHTFVFGEEPVVGTIAPGPDAHELEWIGADGAVVTTPADLVTWMRALYLDRTILGEAGFALMDTVVPMQRGVGYGLGMLRLEPSVTGGNGTMRGHDGAVLGYRASAFAYSDKQWAVVALVAKEGAEVNDFTLAADKVLTDFVPPR